MYPSHRLPILKKNVVTYITADDKICESFLPIRYIDPTCMRPIQTTEDILSLSAPGKPFSQIIPALWTETARQTWFVRSSSNFYSHIKLQTRWMCPCLMATLIPSDTFPPRRKITIRHHISLWQRTTSPIKYNSWAETTVRRRVSFSDVIFIVLSQTTDSWYTSAEGV